MKKEITEERKSILDKLYQAFEIVSEGSYVYLCDIKYDYSRWSETAVQYFGLPGEYMYHAGDIWEQHIHPEDQKSYHESIQDIFSGKNHGHDMQYRARERMGRYVVCTCRGTVMWDENGAPDYFAGTIRNHGVVNNIDPLTGFQNQYGLFEHLNVLYDKQVKASIMMIGIGHFSIINEMWGYDFGNMVIHKLVQLLKEEFRNEGVLYRTDGVRFVLLTRTLSIEELSRRYETLRKEICEKIEIDGYHPNLLVHGSALEIKTFDINPQALYSCLIFA
ncbi:MAG: diguanylate cyclase [Lachnoclostridium sp.]|nr:diguanylate cyclase [Lachnoclostridium sp.]